MHLNLELLFALNLGNYFLTIFSNFWFTIDKPGDLSSSPTEEISKIAF